MKKIIAGILLAQLFFCPFLNAQSTDILRNELNTIFQNIDKSQIPTGYLEEYGPGFAPFSVFNGVLTDSNLCDFTAWQVLYGQISASKIYGSTNLPTLPVTTEAINAAGNSQVFALPLLLMDYNTLNPYAVQQNLFTISNEQIYDVPGRTQSPYLQKTLFSATPAVNSSTNGTITVVVKQDLFFTNTGKSISNVQIDFNDGAGFTATYVGGISPLNSSRSANFIAQETYSSNGTTLFNTRHRFFTARNAHWLFNEMEGVTPNTLNCSDQCQPTGFAIEGEAALCGSSIYNMNAVPSGSSVSWSVNPINCAIVATNGSQVTINPQCSNTSFLLIATINNVCGSAVEVQKTIITGVPDHLIDVIEYMGIETLSTFYANTSYSFTSNAIEPYSYYPYYHTTQYLYAATAAYIWRVIYKPADGTGDVMNYLGSYSNLGQPDFYFDKAGQYDIVLDIINSNCSHSRMFTRTITVQNNQPYFSVYPNPAMSDLTISPGSLKATSSTAKQTSVKKFDKIVITDAMNNIKYSEQLKLPQQQYKINTIMLPDGIYYLQLFSNGRLLEIHSLSVKK